MTSIQKRMTRDGYEHFRVQVRIKDQPRVSATFHKRSDAAKWKRQTEVATDQRVLLATTITTYVCAGA